MTRKDHQIIFTALGFLAVVLRDDIPRDKQALRAASIAQLIESFCMASVPVEPKLMGESQTKSQSFFRGW